jgi:hypothetical protein
MSLTFWLYGALTLLIAAAISLGLGWVAGSRHVQARCDSAAAEQRLAVAEAQTRQAEATVQVVTQYVDRVQVVREKGDTILKEVPVYVPIQADAACTIHRGFVSLHDAAAAGELPPATGDPDAPAEGLTLSAVAGTIASNYQSCHENAEQLKALQDWIRQLR